MMELFVRLFLKANLFELVMSFRGSHPEQIYHTVYILKPDLSENKFLKREIISERFYAFFPIQSLIR
jgi:hypothetical protein